MNNIIGIILTYIVFRVVRYEIQEELTSFSIPILKYNNPFISKYIIHKLDGLGK